MVRKADPSLDNPIDNMLYDAADANTHIFQKLGFTPNGITTMSLFFGLLSSCLLYSNHSVPAMISWCLAYFLDCMDGHYARKYNMVSRFGDYYDHISDATKVLVLIYIMYLMNPSKAKCFGPVILGLCLLSAVHVGCQEKQYGVDNTQPLLDNTTVLCPDKDMIVWTRYFAPASVNLFIALVILLF